jgi:hypothetical protein
MRVPRAAVVFAIGASVLAFTTSPLARQAGDRPVPFHVGEVLTYDVSWSTFVTAGTATMAVRERQPAGNGAFAYDLVAEGRPSTVVDKLYHGYYKAETLLDTRTLQPSIATVYSDERGRTKLQTLRFLGGTSAEFQPKASAPRERLTVPNLSLDPLSALYIMRVVSLKADGVIVMPIIDGRDQYTVRWQVAGPESISTSLGAMRAWRLTSGLADTKGKPIANNRLTIWMSTDSRRLPLKLQIAVSVGSFTLTLAHAAG